MKNKLEQLLNSLIEKGWKPRGKNYGVVDFLGTLVFVDLNDGRLERKNALDLRKLTSKESGLWQFVCENGMVDVKDNRYDFFEYYKGINEEGAFRDAQRYDESYEYRLIESALCDEDKLEEFLLSNIKVDVGNRG